MLEKAYLDYYKRQVTAFFNDRTSYDNDFTYYRAVRLAELASLQPGQTVLDVATGTAIVAIAAAEAVGAEGKVTGVDISPGMLSRARRKIEAANLNNIELIEADIEHIDFEDKSFDAVLCSSSVVWLSNIAEALRNWHHLLKQGGTLAFSCYSETAFLTPIIVKVCAQVYDISLPNWNEPLGTPEKCRYSLQQAGFTDIKITTEQLGGYLSLKEAKQWWQGDKLWINPEGNPLSLLSQKQLNKLKAAYDAEVENLVTSRGVWQDITTFFVIARK